MNNKRFESVDNSVAYFPVAALIPGSCCLILKVARTRELGVDAIYIFIKKKGFLKGSVMEV